MDRDVFEGHGRGTFEATLLALDRLLQLAHKHLINHTDVGSIVVHPEDGAALGASH